MPTSLLGGGLYGVMALMSADPFFEDVHVVKVQAGEYGPRGMPGDIELLSDGSLLLCYTQNGIQGRKSTDEGRTWGEEFTLVPDPAPPSTQGRYAHPSLLRAPNGDLLLSYIYVSESLPYYGHNYYRRSDNDGRTWSEQFCMTPHPGYNLVHNDKLMVLSTGRIIAPVEYKKRWPSEKDHNGYVCLCFYSDDNGYSWQMSANEVDMDPHEAQEPHVVELKDGRLLMIFRTYSGMLGRAFSEDQGITWSKGELLKELPLPRSGAVTVVRIPTTGDLLLIRITGGSPNKPHARSPLTAMISRDEGETWENPRNIGEDPEGDYGYQSVTFLNDVALISYHALDGLHVARIGVEWFYTAP
ncbi:MAG: sialidase family protein [Candidatus Zipacnadales bacterium]